MASCSQSRVDPDGGNYGENDDFPFYKDMLRFHLCKMAGPTASLFKLRSSLKTFSVLVHIIKDCAEDSTSLHKDLMPSCSNGTTLTREPNPNYRRVFCF
jgi:hypothetical protein